ncbi:unnamed protein product [Gulo gulo]|uniref:Uncharacterized protein n=1 Tax=Gulo gulo TaxID=48420 RepID=A0A9X9LKS8_GULGU|nr:unnamed protein product [Gulo gulo]
MPHWSPAHYGHRHGERRLDEVLHEKALELSSTDSLVLCKPSLGEQIQLLASTNKARVQCCFNYVL